MQIIYSIWIFIQVVVGLQLIFPVLSYIVYSLKKKKKIQPTTKENDYAIIVTFYKNTSNLNNVVRSLLKLKHSNYIVYLVADNCDKIKDEFNDPRIVMLYPETVFSNQVKSHFYAIEHFKRAHDLLTIIDSDNLVDENYLTELDQYFNAGYNAVQGVRKAKNTNTKYARVDTINELYYLFYDRIILFGIGSSSMLSGSGMAFSVKLFLDCLCATTITGAGFDKILQKEILKRGHTIAFAKKAIVYDEKTAQKEQLVKQRARWNNTWFRYFKFGYYLMGQGIIHASMNRFLYGFLLTRPPLFLLLILLFFILLANVFISLKAVLIWILLFIIFIAGFFLALSYLKANKSIYRSVFSIPKFIFLQVRSLFKTKKANEYSVATEHSYNQDIEKI